MAQTNTDQWANKSLKIEREKEKAGVFREGLNLGLMIAGKGGSPGQPYDDPEKGKGPFVPAPKRVASTQIKPNQIMLPFVPKDAETDEAYGEGNVPGHPDWSGINKRMTIAGGPSFDIGPGHGAAKKKAKGFNKTRNNPNDKEVEMIKKWLGGPQLPDVSEANINESLQRENVGGTLRDVLLPPAMKEYGKTPSGGYKNPGALLSIMKKLAQGKQETIGPDPRNPVPGTNLFIRPSDQRRIKNHDKYFGSKLA